MQVTHFHPLTFGMTVPLFTEIFDSVKGRFFNKIRLLIIYIDLPKTKSR